MRYSLLLAWGVLALLFSCTQPQAPSSVANADTKSDYQEMYRPQFHFSPPEKWMNDPNGLFFLEGEYHLFYQHYPDSSRWGPMHWGHAVSRDLVYWQHLPIALYPDSLGYIFSGSAVVDWKNTSGLGQNGVPPIVAIFTYHDMKGEKAGEQDFQYQGMAFSTDKGRTWTKYSGNPVLPNTEQIRDFRDPNVKWHEETQQWIMVLAANDCVRFYASKDLKKWAYLSEWGKDIGAHGGVWECPDLFPMTVEGTGARKWVLLQSINPGGFNGGSATQYFVGNFTGTAFVLDADFATLLEKGKGVWLDYGRDNYAGITWSDIPEKDGRRLWMGWMSNWDYAQEVPTERWRSAMTLPRVLTLKNTAAGLRIIASPVEELKSLRDQAFLITPTVVTGTQPLLDHTEFKPRQSEIILEFEVPTAHQGQLGLLLSNSKGEEYRIGFDAGKNQFFSDRTKAGKNTFSKKFAEKIHIAPREWTQKKCTMHFFFDRASVELFAADGAVCLTDIYFPTESFDQVQIFSTQGSVSLQKGQVYTLRSIW